MKWLKHMTASWDDEKISRLISQHGLTGYGTWWRVAEIVAAQLEGSGKPEVTYHVSKWSHLLSVRGSHVVRTLVTLQVTHLVTVERHGDDITVRIPNLLKYRDEYSRKSGHSQERLRKRTEGDTDKEGEQIHTKTRVRVSDLNGQTSQRFDEFWDRYPRQQHRDAACHQWLSVVTIEVEPALFACLGRYLASDDVQRGIVSNPEKWLLEQHRDGWAGTWPVARNNCNGNGNGKKTAIQSALERAREEDKRNGIPYESH